MKVLDHLLSFCGVPGERGKKNQAVRKGEVGWRHPPGRRLPPAPPSPPPHSLRKPTHVVVRLFGLGLNAGGQVHEVVRQLERREKMRGEQKTRARQARWWGRAPLSLSSLSPLPLTGFFMSFTPGRTSLGRVLLNDLVPSPMMPMALPVSTTSACFGKRKCERAFFFLLLSFFFIAPRSGAARGGGGPDSPGPARTPGPGRPGRPACSALWCVSFAGGEQGEPCGEEGAVHVRAASAAAAAATRAW